MDGVSSRLYWLLGRVRAVTGGAAPGTAGQPEPAETVARADRHFLLYFVMPVWQAAGFLDYLQHRRSHIETTAGARESAIHLLMMTEAAVPSLMGLFLDVDALVLLTTILDLFLHEATAIWDVAYAEPRRLVTPNEQHIHSFLEVIPFMATSFLICMHWSQFRSLAGRGPERARWSLRRKQPPLSRRYVAAVLSGLVSFIGIPYAEEFWRCYRASRTLAPQAAPPLARTPTLRLAQD